MVRTLAPGQVFAGYQIERLLGVGGMGQVYLARDRDLPRWVALKILSRGAADDDNTRERFLREADIAAGLAHPNIVAVHARGEEGEQLWMAMQFVAGFDAAALLRGGPVDPARATRIIGDVAGALDYAHRAGVLHRDVKPANILLTTGPQEHAFLADFGIAKALDHTGSLTRTGVVHASFQYAAPEQFDPNTPVDPRADVYALGCTLYHLLTGQPPYAGSDAGTLIHGHYHLPVPRPTALNPLLPKGFDQVIARAMAKRREDRFASCGELAAAAWQALNSLPPAPDPAGKRFSRSRIALSAVMLVLSAAAIGSIFAIRGGLADSLFEPADAADSAAEAARQAGCEFAHAFTTMDTQNFDTFQQAVLAGSTGDMKTETEKTLSRTREAVKQAGIRSSVKFIDCAVESSEGDSAQVLAAVTQSTVSTATPTENSMQYRFRLTMELIDGRWLCGKLESVD